MTFEFVCVRVVVNRYVCTVVTVYRQGLESVLSAFFDELTDLLDTVTRTEPATSTLDSIALTTRLLYGWSISEATGSTSRCQSLHTNSACCWM